MEKFPFCIWRKRNDVCPDVANLDITQILPDVQKSIAKWTFSMDGNNDFLETEITLETTGQAAIEIMWLVYHGARADIVYPTGDVASWPIARGEIMLGDPATGAANPTLLTALEQIGYIIRH